MLRSPLVQVVFRSFPVIALVAVVGLLATPHPGAGQDLALKREVPDLGPYRCGETPPVEAPSDEARSQADRLGSNASQALILGDTERAQDLLARATQLDASSPELAYQYGRILEERGAASGAIAQYCRVLALDPEFPGAPEVVARLESLTASGRPAIPPEAVLSFETGLGHADAGRSQAALEAFRAASAAAPYWPTPVYDEAVLLLELGRREDAAEALERYLELDPSAGDAMAVSQRIGQLRAPLSLPSPGAALGLGLVVPGMGQFYTGRPLPGFMVLALAGGAAATGLLIEEVTVLCVDPVPPGEDCPSARVRNVIVERPYETVGLAAAGAVVVFGAIEAFVKARRRGRRASDAGLASLDVGGTRVDAFVVATRGGGVDVRWLQVRF
jgi:tetratricopeptide (TPR) repeat protein